MAQVQQTNGKAFGTPPVRLMQH